MRSPGKRGGKPGRGTVKVDVRQSSCPLLVGTSGCMVSLLAVQDVLLALLANLAQHDRRLFKCSNVEQF